MGVFGGTSDRYTRRDTLLPFSQYLQCASGRQPVYQHGDSSPLRFLSLALSFARVDSARIIPREEQAGDVVSERTVVPTNAIIRRVSRRLVNLTTFEILFRGPSEILAVSRTPEHINVSPEAAFSNVDGSTKVCVHVGRNERRTRGKMSSTPRTSFP